jgi:hypothetical protein
MSTLLLIIFALVPILLWTAAIYYIFKAIGEFAKAGVSFAKLKQDKKTNFHYYDRDDMYFDYHQGQWYYKPGYPQVESA